MIARTPEAQRLRRCGIAVEDRQQGTPGSVTADPYTDRYHRAMPLYMIERTFADQLDLTNEDVTLIEEVNADEGVRWLFSFLSADRRRTYCLYEAPSAQAIVAAARRANVPADEVVEVGPGTPMFAGRLQDWAEGVRAG